MINLVCNSNTVYTYDEYEDEGEEENIIKEFNLKKNEKEYFKKIYLYTDDFIEYNNIKEIEENIKKYKEI